MRDIKASYSLIALGNTFVGKTSLSNRFCNNSFREDYLNTIGFDYYSREIIFENNKYQIEIWDTAGQERYETVTSQYLRNAQGIAIVYDVSSRNSFDKIMDWLNVIKDKYGTRNIPTILIGNKIDIPQREVSREMALKLAYDKKLKYFEVSAKSGEGVDEAFMTLFKLVLNNEESNEKELDKIILNKNKVENNIKKNSEKCCNN